MLAAVARHVSRMEMRLSEPLGAASLAPELAAAAAAAAVRASCSHGDVKETMCNVKRVTSSERRFSSLADTSPDSQVLGGGGLDRFEEGYEGNCRR